MKEILSVFTFGIGALCFVVFVTVLKPNAISAVPGPSRTFQSPMLSATHRRSSRPVPGY
jgi:hypothetical protein